MPAARTINRLLDEYTARRANAVAFTSMGALGYLSAMRYCEAVVGNSSSGVVEAPSFQKPTVNIGDRQKGRLRCRSILDCGTGHRRDRADAAGRAFPRFCTGVQEQPQPL